jgi:transketolase
MTTTAATNLDQLCIDTIRTLAMDTVQKAKSGHPGTPMGAAPMAYTLWTQFLKHNPANPHWPDRDRFVLSAGHASVLLYSLLALTGYDLKLEELKDFRQFGSRTPGHPEYGHTPGVEVTTGPLGQGFAMGVGLAIAEHHLAARFNREGHSVVDHYTYGICSDGDLMEGISSEAASLAGHLQLGKLIYLYDDNNISIEGSTALAFTEDVARRFEAYGWHVQSIDGQDVDGVAAALDRARRDTDRPSLIVARTVIAYGSPNKAGTAAAHGSALGDEEVRLTKRALGWPEDSSFYVPDEALQHYREALPRGAAFESDWQRRFDAYAAEYPSEATLFQRWMMGQLPDGWADDLPTFSAADGAPASRVASGKVMNVLASRLENFIGGSADLAPSTETNLKGLGSLDFGDWAGRNMHFGVREHAMGAIVNGMAMHGGLLPFGATFLVFSDYMRGAIRIGAVMGAHAVWVFTHDSIGLGEDGPTHQPIEHLASLRAMPGIRVIRPADANETVAAWKLAIELPGPTALVLSRQGLPVIEDAGRARAGAAMGAYVLVDSPGEPDVILLGTGSEVSIAVDAAAKLAAEGINARVVSMPSWEVFEEQAPAYRETVLSPRVRARVAVEAASPLGWHKYIGDAGAFVGIDHFGGSAPGTDLYKHFNITADAVIEATHGVLDRLAQERS